jgi:hypothetical protein
MSYPAPNVLNYMVGKGRVYFDRFTDAGVSTGELHLGNDPVFAETPVTETLDHFSSMEGIKLKDLSVNLSAGINLKFTLDEINVKNLDLAFLGDGVEYTVQAAGNQANEPITAHIGKYIKLNRRKLVAGTVNVTNVAGTITYVDGVDYEVDTTIGRVLIITGGTIAENQVLHVDYTYDACNIPTIKPITNTKVEGLIRFVGNCTHGSDFEIVHWKVKLAASGDINFISDEWAQMEFTAEVLSDAANHPDSPFGEIIDLEADTAPES